MGSTLQFCLHDVAHRRPDLGVRPIPEIRLCMVYRPRPARIITLNPRGWLLFELCDGSLVADILTRYEDALTRRGRRPLRGDGERGLRSLLDNELIILSPGAAEGSLP